MTLVKTRGHPCEKSEGIALWEEEQQGKKKGSELGLSLAYLSCTRRLVWRSEQGERPPVGVGQVMQSLIGKVKELVSSHEW